MRIRELFVMTAVALGALSVSATPVQGQSRDPDVATEEAFHRDEELELLRSKVPAAVLPLRWQEAYLGDDNGVRHPQYLATLLREYASANATNKMHTIKWVEALAAELVQRGDGEMFMILAAHYVHHHTNVNYDSAFSGRRLTLGRKIEHLGALINKNLAAMAADDQRKFKESFARAVAGTIVNNCDEDGDKPLCNPSPDLPLAVLGYRLLVDYCGGSGPDAASASRSAFREMRGQLAKHTLSAEDMQGLFTHQGIVDFQQVTSTYTLSSQSPVMMLMEMGVRVDAKTGHSLRRLFMSYLQQPENRAFAIFLFNRTFQAAHAQRATGQYNSMALRTIAPEWQNAVSETLTVDAIKALYMQVYVNGAANTQQLLLAARHKDLTAQQQKQMVAVFAAVLKQAAAKPELYYRMMDDFKGNAQYQAALLDYQPTMPLEQVAKHYRYLANIYITATAIDKTIDSNLRLTDLVKVNAALPKPKQMHATTFKGIVLQFAKDIAGDEDKSYQLAKLVSTSMNMGWAALVTPELVANMRSTLKTRTDGFASETLDTILRVKAEQKLRDQMWSITLRGAIRPKP